MLSPERIGAFVEYVARPLVEDVRLILEKAKELNLPVSENLVRKVGIWIASSHIIGEIIRAVTYIIITAIICRTTIRVLH